MSAHYNVYTFTLFQTEIPEQSTISAIIEDCAKMAEDHPNVLSLIGVCLDGGPAPFIIMPFMHNGSLVYYLKRERETLVLPPQEKLDFATVREQWCRKMS